ncbi:translocation/assembly module TamB domain-containing protein [Kordiimonas pumila]|uniref:Translocation/assembly module TamB domain-containing protein n=1 Tax=Kordiimonas pumila TaxID=2161677 RepID=A0ABV7D9I5_9PROT|nr:translocation/assembly module TamB domain-containing protein [Kordiimonas pumila]
MTETADIKPSGSLKAFAKKLLTALLGLAAVVAVTVGGALLWLSSDTGKNWLAGVLSEKLDSPGFDISLASIEGSLFSNFSVHGLTIADAEGTWLEAPKLDVTWSPSALWGGTIAVEQVAGDTVTAHRMPTVPASEQAGDTGGTAFLPSLIIGDVDLQVVYAEMPYRLSLSKVALSPERAEGALVFTDQGQTDRVQASVRWAADNAGKANKKFRLAVDLLAQKGGMLGDMIGLKAQEPLVVRLSGGGVPDKWQGTIDAAMEGALQVSGNASGNREELTLTLKQAQNSFLPAEVWALWGAEAEAVIQAKIGDVREITVEVDSRVSGAGAKLSGVLETKDGWRLENANLTLDVPTFKGAGVAAETIRIEAGGSLGLKNGHVKYLLTGASLQQGAANLGAIDTLGVLTYDAKGVSGTVDTAKFAAFYEDTALESVVLSGGWAYDYEGKNWQVDVSKAVADIASANNVTVKGTGGQFEMASGHIESSVSALAPFHDGRLTGGNLKLDVESHGDGEAVETDITLTTASMAYADEKLASLLGLAPQVNAKIRQTPEQISLQGLKIDGAALSVTSEGSVKPDGTGLDIEAAVKLANIAALTGNKMTMTGSLDVMAHATGSLKAPAITLETALASLDGYGVALTDPTLTAKLSPDPALENAWAGTVDLHTETTAGTVTINTSLAVTPEILALDEIHVALPGIGGTGAMALAFDGPVDGYLNLKLQETTLETVQLQGMAELDMQLTGTTDNFQVAINVSADNAELIRQGAFPLRMEIAAGALDIGWYAGELNYNTDIIIKGISQGSQHIDVIHIAGVSGSNAPLTLEANGYLGNSFTVEAGLTSQDKKAELSFSLLYGGVQAATTDTVKLDWADGFSLSAPAFTLAGGEGSLEASLQGDTEKALLKLDTIDMAFLNILRPGTVSAGSLSADVTFERLHGAETGVANFHFNNTEFAGGSFLEEKSQYSADLKATLKDHIIYIDGAAIKAGQTFGTLVAELPYERADGRKFKLKSGVPLKADLNWEGDIAPIWVLARRPNHILSGLLDGQLHLEGTLEAPVFDGQLEMKNGHYEYEPLGLVADIARLEVSGNQERIKLAALEATDGAKGTLSGTGYVELAENLSFPGQLNFTLSDFQVARQDHMNGTASADLSYVREKGGASTLKGSVETGRINVAMPRELPRSVVEIDVTEMNGFDDDDAALDLKKPTKQVPVVLDVAVSIPRAFFFEGRGLTSEWQGNLHMGGTSDDPRLLGSMTIREGNFKFGSKDFKISDGLLSFKGGRGFDPDLAITAEYNEGSLAARLQISGPASAPVIKLSSVPPLPEDEIMSRILFGRSVTEISALQVAEVAVAIDTLRGGSKFDMVGQLRRKLGLDTLTFGTSDTEESATLIRGGKYIRDNIYLEVETSTASSETSTRLKIDITKNLLAETEVGPRQGSRLSIKWFWDY